jgi:hypothetical protein
MANDTKDTQAAQFDVSESTGYQKPRNGGLQGSAHAGSTKSGSDQGSASAVREDASAQTDPRHHTSKVKRKLQELRDHLREDVGEGKRTEGAGAVRDGSGSPPRVAERVRSLRAQIRAGYAVKRASSRVKSYPGSSGESFSGFNETAPWRITTTS